MKKTLRSLLYIPGSSKKMIGKAPGVAADAVIFDLEDAVSIAEKDNARDNLVEAIPALIEMGKNVIVRANAMDTLWGVKDLLAIAPLAPLAFIIPKASESYLITADMILTAVEDANGMEIDSIGLIPLVETSYGIANINAILASTSRVIGVQLGAEDLTRDLQIERTRLGAEVAYARTTLAYAARARGIVCLDTPFSGIRDPEGLQIDTTTAKSIGFTGKTCIHPAQIETVNAIFTPTEEEVTYARGVVAAYEEAQAQGKGAVMYEGKMVDKPIYDRALGVLAKADLV